MKCNQKGCEVDGPTESGHCPVCGHVLATGNGEDKTPVAVAGLWSEQENPDEKSHFFMEGVENSLCGHVSIDAVTLSEAGSDSESEADCKSCVKGLEEMGA